MRKIIFLLAAALLAWGIYQKEYLTVMQKAASVCLECIGIG